MPNAKITSIQQTEETGLFSIIFDGESYSEFEKFILKYQGSSFSRELNIILAFIDKMSGGASFLERYFRPEGKYNDHVCALPIESGKLRLYCLRLSDQVLIVGNGGVKTTRRYEDDENLSGYVITLQKLDELINVAIKKGNITIQQAHIQGTDKCNFEL